jgi:hypothetical protein
MDRRGPVSHTVDARRANNDERLPVLQSHRFDARLLLPLPVACLPRGDGRRDSERAYPGYPGLAFGRGLLRGPRACVGDASRYPLARLVRSGYPDVGGSILAPHRRRGTRGLRVALALAAARR